VDTTADNVNEKDMQVIAYLWFDVFYRFSNMSGLYSKRILATTYDNAALIAAHVIAEREAEDAYLVGIVHHGPYDNKELSDFMQVAPVRPQGND
jgi:hypothetical protein